MKEEFHYPVISMASLLSPSSSGSKYLKVSSCDPVDDHSGTDLQ